MAVALSVVTWLGSTVWGYGLVLVKYPHQCITFIALLKHILNMAQFALFGSRRGIFAGSFSIEVGAVVVDTVDVFGVTVDILEEGRGVGERLGDDAREVGTKELVGLDGVVACRAGPITCSKYG
jgi:hypothetical protein